MSLITNIILIGSAIDIEKVNKYFEGKDKDLLRNVTEHAGGTKVFYPEIYIGAFNYLNLDEFIKTVKDCCKYYQLFIDSEQFDHSGFVEIKKE